MQGSGQGKTLGRYGEAHYIVVSPRDGVRRRYAELPLAEVCEGVGLLTIGRGISVNSAFF
jgi:hypothetical protein